MSDPIQHFVRHVVSCGYDDFPEEAIAAAKTFILDSVGVGLIGSMGPWAKELIDVQKLSGDGHDARVWSHGTWLPAPSAAMCNAYQIHNSDGM